MKFAAFIFFYFIYIFGPVLNSISPIVDFIFFFSIILYIYNRRLFAVDSTTFICLVLPVFIVSIYSSIVLLFYENVSLSYYLQVFLSPIRVVVTILGAYSLVNITVTSGFKVLDIYKLVFFAGLFHATIMCFQLVSLDFRNFIYEMTISSEVLNNASYYYEKNFRMGGVSGGFGSAVLSASQALCLLTLPFITAQIDSRLSSIKYYFFSFIIVVSVIFSGRSGLMILLIFFPLSIYLANIHQSKRVAFLKTFSLIPLLIVLVSLALIYISSLDENSDLYLTVTRSFELLINFSNGNYNDNTVTTLKSFLVLPSNFTTWVFGDGQNLFNTQFDRILDSDIGFIRNLWSIGLFFSIIYWFPFFYLFVKCMLNKFSSYYGYLFVVVFVTIFMHMKEDVFYSRILLSILGVFIAIAGQDFLKRKGERC